MSIQNPLGPEPRPGNHFATFGGGCFWCLEAVFEEVRGVIDVESGYSGGHGPNPDYRSVCAGTTGHAEVVRLEYDPAQVTYQQLLGVFFGIHDPTTLNRQGNDVGTQYRSVIFFHDAEQERAARRYIADAAHAWRDPLVTEILPAPEYWRAETYHQEYFRHNPQAGYCAFVVGPKVSKFRKYFSEVRKPGL